MIIPSINIFRIFTQIFIENKNLNILPNLISSLNLMLKTGESVKQDLWIKITFQSKQRLANLKSLVTLF